MQSAPTFFPPSATSRPVVVVETAYEWFQRSQRARIAQSVAPPPDPAAAAWAFCRPSSSAAAAVASSNSSGTGIAFVDAALRSNAVHLQHPQQQQQQPQSLPVVDLRGATDTGKTWIVVSLAARFVVATRLSQFLIETHRKQQRQSSMMMLVDGEVESMRPQVIIFDSQYNVTLPKLVYAVRSLLLLRLSSNGAAATTAPTTQQENEEEWQEKAMYFEQDMKDCLSRIQIAHSPHGDLMGWVPILETTRVQLAQTAADYPTLILWDGFLSEPDASNEGARMEVIRQVERLLLDCSVLLIATTTSAPESASHSSTARSNSTGHNRREWERFITQRIRLDRTSTNTPAHNSTGNNHEYLASVNGAQIPFSISMAGILS